MPRNMFQRPVPVTRNHNVPRHGAPLPVKKLEARKVLPPKPDLPALLPLEALLSKPTKH